MNTPFDNKCQRLYCDNFVTVLSFLKRLFALIWDEIDLDQILTKGIKNRPKFINQYKSDIFLNY